MVPCPAQAPDPNPPGTEVLTRGPVHEAFAGIITFNPEPGAVVTKAPPELIEELPPEERPAGENVAWIPGYWGWDDERGDFLWVSGTWRALPPGRAWIAGYWGQTPQGHQWISGYWAEATARETTYLPPPPATVEAGPNLAAPSADYGWTPGCWIWYSGRYAWSPGYWAAGRADWDWIPAHYVWTPRGYIFVGGYWDYPVQRRGILFAPVYFEPGIYSRRGYRYAPTIVIDLGLFNDHLFLRPRYNHYYFGDYYAASYGQAGFYASFSFQSSRFGYDPFYSRQRWEHRRDREWAVRVQTTYNYRRDHEAARPPRTWAAQRGMNASAPESRENRMLVAAPLEQIARRKDGPMKFQPVTPDERPRMTQRGQEVQQARNQRRSMEAKAGAAAPGSSAAVLTPVNVPQPPSPIVAKSVNQLERSQAPPPAPRAPQPDTRIQAPLATPARPQNVERNRPQPELGQPDAGRQAIPPRNETPPREKPAPRQIERRAPDAVGPTTDAPQRKAREENVPNARRAEPPIESTRPAREAAPPTGEAAPREGREVEKPARRESPARQRPAPSEKGGPRLLEKNSKKPDARP
jgi:hypothetical protein